ncbi:hypothetical protein Hanom_Chr06g00501121 [Helianthus anomalus]
MLSKFTPSVQIPSPDDNSTLERVYYSSARSLSSHTPTVSFFHSQRTNANKHDQDTVQEPPLLDGHVSRQSPPASETKTMLCVVSLIGVFLCICNLQLERNSYLNLDSVKSHNGVVMQVGRRLLQVRNRFCILTISGGARPLI